MRLTLNMQTEWKYLRKCRHCCLVLSSGGAFNLQDFKTRQNQTTLTSELGTRRECEGGSGNVLAHQACSLAIWCCALWDSAERCAFFLIHCGPQTQASYFSWVQPLMNKGDFDKCNVCFTADYQASLSDEMPLHYFL